MQEDVPRFFLPSPSSQAKADGRGQSRATDSSVIFLRKPHRESAKINLHREMHVALDILIQLRQQAGASSSQVA